MLLTPRGVLSERGPPGIAQGLGQQLVRPVAAFVWAQEIDLFEIDPVDLRERDEFGDVDGIGGLLLQGLEFLGGEHHVLVLGKFIPLGHVVPGHDLTVLRTGVLLLEPGAAFLVEQVERHGAGRFGRGIDVNRDRDQAEGDGGGADRTSGHERPPVSGI